MLMYLLTWIIRTSTEIAGHADEGMQIRSIRYVSAGEAGRESDGEEELVKCEMHQVY